MTRPLRPLLDPTRQRRDLLRRELLVGIRGRHTIGRVLARDARDELTLPRLARNDGDLLRDVLLIQSQFALSILPVRAVALKAPVRQDRPDVAIESKGGFVGAEELT